MSANPIVHWELMGPDGDGLKSFYASIFDWSFASMEGFEGYYTTEGENMGVNGAIGRGSDEMPVYQCIYVSVEDIDAKLAEVEANGGAMAMPRTEIPGVVTFAMFKDPAGNLVGLVEAGE